MCSRIITFVIRTACGSTKSLFLIGTSRVWKLTEWSFSHYYLSVLHYRDALWPLFSPIIHARASSPALWGCDSYPITPKITSFIKPQSCQPPIQHPTRPHLWPLRHPHRQDSPLPVSVSEVHMSPDKGGWQRRNTALWHCVKRGSQHYASRQTKIRTPWHYANGSVWLVLTWLHTTLFISIIRYRNGCWVRSMRLKQSRKFLSQRC